MRGTCYGRFEHGEYEIEYTAVVTADYYYQPGRMYMPNGDPGYPPEEEIDNFKVEDIDEIHVWKGEEELEDFDFEEFEKLCIKHAEDAETDDCQWDEPEPEYDNED